MRQASPAGHDGPNIKWNIHPALRQISLAAWFSTFADQHDNLDLVVHEACKVAMVGVRARFAELLQFRADQRAFVLQARPYSWEQTWPWRSACLSTSSPPTP